jgi:hypothetical protein
MALVGWPAVVDDAGAGQDGTVWNAALNAAQKAAIENDVSSSTNPTVRAKDIIDEVVEARGTMLSLDDRLDVSLNEDGTPKPNPLVVTVAQGGSLAGTNFIPNDCFLVWSLGDALAPDFTVLSGAGAAVARCGNGLGDATTVGYGDFCARLTYGAALARLTWSCIPAADFGRATGLRGRRVSAGVRVRSSTAGIARITISDGILSTSSAFHSGGGGSEWLSVVHLMSGAATELSVHCELLGAGTGYFGAATGLVSDLPPNDWFPCLMETEVINLFLPGVQTTGVNKIIRPSPGVGIVTNIQLRALTAPVGAALIVDVNSWDGVSAFVSMCTTKPTIADGFNSAGVVPDAAYRERCLRGFWVVGAPTVPLSRSYLSVDIDQVGSGTPGSDLAIDIYVRKYLRVFEQILSYNAI